MSVSVGLYNAISKVPGSKSNEFIWLNWNYAQLHKSPGVFYYTAPDHLALFSPVFHGMFMFLEGIHEQAKLEHGGAEGVLLTLAAHCVACLNMCP